MARFSLLTPLLGLLLLVAPSAKAALLPNGNVAWGFETANFGGSLVWAQDGQIGVATVWNKSNGRSASGFASWHVDDRPHGQIDSLHATISFNLQEMSLVLGQGLFGGPLPTNDFGYFDLRDFTGVAFDGVTTNAPVDLPPLSAFTEAKLALPYWGLGGSGSIELLFRVQTLTALPEPESLWFLGALAAIARKRSVRRETP